MRQEIKCKNSSEASKFIQIDIAINHIKIKYFDKWHLMLIEMEKQKVQLGFKKQYLQVINSDIICTISYIDTILNDVSNYLEYKKDDTTTIRFLDKNNFFSLLTLLRPVILHTAHINLYYKLKDKIEPLTYDIFKKKPSADKSKIRKGDKTIFDALAGMINIYDFGRNDEVSILGQINDDVKTLLETSKITDFGKVKYLEKCIKEDYSALLKEREIEVLYETTSKIFHRQELLMLVLHVLLIKDYNSGNVVDDIFRFVRLGVFLLGLQLKIFLELIDKLEESKIINKDLGSLMQVGQQVNNGMTL